VVKHGYHYILIKRETCGVEEIIEIKEKEVGEKEDDKKTKRKEREWERKINE